MSFETSKCFEIRKRRGDFDNYINGNGIDVGCAGDVLKLPKGKTVIPWDKKDGDAQLMFGLADNSFDFVYSSHCLEHLENVEQALTSWTRILKPRGYLYVVVPDYLLYEKLNWPSRFNFDHKHSFSETITRRQVQRENHWNLSEDLEPLLSGLGLVLERWGLEDEGYNWNKGFEDQTRKEALAQICFVARKL